MRVARASSPPPTHSSDKPRINLLRGWPAPSLLPAGLLKSAADKVLEDPALFIPGLQYGPDMGDERALRVIARWLADFYSQPLDDEARVVMTGGASQGLGLMLVRLTDPLYTQAVWVASPSYFLAFKAFEDAGFAAEDARLNPIREDEEGIDIGQLASALEASDRMHSTVSHTRETFKPRHNQPKLYRHVIYCVPSFSNPSSVTMSNPRREELVRLARKHDALVICDDVYDMLQFDARDESRERGHDVTRAAHPRLVDIDRILDGGVERSEADGFGNTVSNGSFSKLLGPGLRCGWIETSTKLAWAISQTGMQKSGGAPSHFTSTYIAELVESGAVSRHITERLQPAYARRHGVMREAIEKHLIPLGASLVQPGRSITGGFFVWVHLPQPVRGLALAQRALTEENLVIANGEMFEVPGQQSIHSRNNGRGDDHEAILFPHDIRLCFAWVDEEELSEGIARLARALEQELSSIALRATDEVAAVTPQLNCFA